jgi:hypothetical protein
MDLERPDADGVPRLLCRLHTVSITAAGRRLVTGA